MNKAASFLFWLTVSTALHVGQAQVKSAVDPKKAVVDITKAQFDTDNMQQKYARDPEFSKDSNDTKKTDEQRVVVNKVRVERATSATEGLYNCGKAGTLAEIQKCRKDLFQKHQKN